MMIEVICNDRLGKKVRVKCNDDDTIGDLKKLIAAQTGNASLAFSCTRFSVRRVLVSPLLALAPLASCVPFPPVARTWAFLQLEPPRQLRAAIVRGLADRRLEVL